MAVTTELIEGNTVIADDLFTNPDGKVIATIGDSITSQMGHVQLTTIGQMLGVKSLHYGGGGATFSFSADVSDAGAALIIDGAATVPNHSPISDDADLATPLLMSNIDVAGTGIVPSASSYYYFHQTAMKFPWNSVPDEAIAVDAFEELIGYDWFASAIAAGDITVSMYVYKHPNGPQTNGFFFQIRHGSAIAIWESALFNGYAATAGWHEVTLTIPQSYAFSGVDGFTCEVCAEKGIDLTSDDGTTLVMCSRVSFTSVLPGVGIVLAARGGKTIGDYLSTDQAAFDLLETMGVTHWFHSLGQNGVVGRNNANDFEADTKSLIAMAPAAVDHVFVPTHGTASYASGGEVDEAYFVTGYSQVVHDVGDYLLLNRHRYLPPFAAMDKYLGDGIHVLADAQYIVASAELGLLREAARRGALAGDVATAVNASQLGTDAAAAKTAAVSANNKLTQVTRGTIS